MAKISRENIGNQIMTADHLLEKGHAEMAMAYALVALAKMEFTKLKINNV